MLNLCVKNMLNIGNTIILPGFQKMHETKTDLFTMST
ncbi:Uncharacterised protein [Klebsiella pneumoniae]|nr:Uncharacterised protein [Klebsiella pneumoniae]